VKLAGNAESRRAVVAQVLSYAGYLQGLDPGQLEPGVLAAKLGPAESVLAAVEADDQQYGLDRAAFQDGLARSLADGSFRLVIVLDSAPDELHGAAGRPRVSSLLGVPIERREFLLLGGAVAAGASLAGCTSTRRVSVPPRGSHPASPHAAPSPTVSPPGRAGVQRGAQVVHGSRSRARVALTFHGQGPASMAGALLAEAERAGAQVTVLAVGTWLEQYPQMARRVLRGGHDLGNHTLHHLDIAAMDASGAYREIAGCALRLRALTRSIGRWFRPSQTRYATALIEQAARRAGYRTCVSYDVDSLDYTDPGPDAVVATVLGSVRPGSIISLHLGHPGTVTALPAILHGLAGRGLRPVTLTELLSR